MTAPSEPLSLASEFPPTTQAEWRTLVDAALKGASFEKRLVSQTYDSLRIDPLYARATEAKPIATRHTGAWQIMQRVDHPDAAAANAEALHDLENGATGLTLVFAGAGSAHGYGIDPSEASLARVLDGVHLDAGIAIDLELSQSAREAPHRLAALVQQRGLAPAATNIRLGLNPLGGILATGRAVMLWHDLVPHFAELVRKLSEQGFKGPFAVADGRLIHGAGGSEAQELAFAIACAVAYLRALESGGVPLDQARRAIYFRLAADADQFLTMAKFRALRKLWARVEEACGLRPEPAFVAAETAWRMLTQRDPYVNMLRTGIAVTAAAVGGADAITALPFTLAIGLPDRFTRRVARNTQLVLLEESNLAKVTDPAAGSGGLEHLTTELAQKAWALFQEIEAAGGAADAIERGLIQQKVAAVRAAREKAVAKRKDTLTGSSDYPNLGELPVTVLDVPKVNVGPPLTDARFPALPQMRLAEPFETLRDAADAMQAKTGKAPQVFLATLGKLSQFNARAMFAKNFYEAGGIEAPGHDGFNSREEMIAAFKASGAKLACLCSSDKVYETEAADVAKALTAAGAVVHLAGRPGEHEKAWSEAGMKAFIFLGCDVLATLKAAHDILGVEKQA